MVIKIINLDKCLRKFKNLEGVDLMPAITAGARKVKDTARDIVPVDTGYLKGNIRYKSYRDQNSAIVYNIVEYGPHIEFGTVKMEAQPFMVPAMLIHEKDIKKNLRDHIKKELGKRTK